MSESERLKDLRKSLSLKQGDFAKKIATTQGHISDIENGRKSLSDRTIKLICLEFGVNEDWLRTGKGEMFTDSLTVANHNFMVNYLSLDPRDRQIVHDLVQTMLKNRLLE